ncbi:hypothetical protein [Intrasporangium mesophilum]
MTALNALTTIPVVGAEGSPDQTIGVVGRAVHRGGTDGPDGPDGPERTVPLDRAERRAVSALLAAGLVNTTAANSARAVLDEELPVGRARGARRAV